MPPRTPASPDLRAVLHHCAAPVSDREFLHVLKAFRCVIVPPSVLQLHEDGSQTAIATLVYTPDDQLDKPRILTAVLTAILEDTDPDEFPALRTPSR